MGQLEEGVVTGRMAKRATPRIEWASPLYVCVRNTAECGFMDAKQGSSTVMAGKGEKGWMIFCAVVAELQRHLATEIPLTVGTF